MMLLFTSNSGINFMVDEEKVGKLLSYKDIMACFADPVIMLFIGGFILAIAATKTGLDAQLARILLKPFGTKSENVLLGFILITGFFSMFVSNTATAAMMLKWLEINKPYVLLFFVVQLLTPIRRTKGVSC